MGTPLLLIGTSAAKWLPESGSWMNAVKAFFGILLIAVAIYLMDRILPASLTMCLCAALLIFSGIYIGALTHSASNKDKFLQGLGIILFAYGLLILIGASMGSTNPLQPLIHLPTAQAETINFPDKKEQTLSSLKQSIAGAVGKPVMLDFYADWCASCKVMESLTFKDPKVAEALSHFKIIKVDVTANNANNKEIMNYFKVIAPPTFLFFDAKGQELDYLKTVGESSAGQFSNVLAQVIKG